MVLSGDLVVILGKRGDIKKEYARRVLLGLVTLSGLISMVKIRFSCW